MGASFMLSRHLRAKVVSRMPTPVNWNRCEKRFHEGVKGWYLHHAHTYTEEKVRLHCPCTTVLKRSAISERRDG